jgi:hypothetical protein
MREHVLQSTVTKSRTMCWSSAVVNKSERHLRQFAAQRDDLSHDEFELGAGRVPLVVSRRVGRPEK